MNRLKGRWCYLKKKGVKFRIYPNKRQENLILQTFGCCRLIYNKGLDMRDKAYKGGGKVNYVQTAAMLTALKKDKDFAFLKLVDSTALQQSLRDLDKAYTNFFKKKARFPRFKSKHNNHQSYRTININGNIRIVDGCLKMPKLGYVKVKQSMEVGHINNVTIEKTPTGKYFAVLNVDFEPGFKQNNGRKIGIDVGLKTFYTDSNGNKVDNPKHLEEFEKKLKREQRRLARKQKGSRNRNKQRIKVARVHEKVTNKRNDFLQKESTRLVRENQTIAIESLNVKGMVRNHRLARAISSVSWGRFFAMLEYKAAWYGNTIIRVPTFYPSSQTCSKCGSVNPLVKNLSVREWECPFCHTKHDRDYNASINILNKGLSLA